MYTVITDTSANLPTAMLQERRIDCIPFTYYDRGQECQCLDTAAFDGHAYYQSMRDGELMNTSQITPQAYIDCFTPYLQEGLDVLFVGMSSGISGAYGSAVIAADELRESFPDRTIRLLDTRCASLGEGMIALRAADLRDEGVPIDEAYDQLIYMTDCICEVFTVNDLMYLCRTGRLSNLTARVGTMLNLKPLLTGDVKGRIVTFGKVRGRRRALEALAAIYDAKVVNPAEQRICIAHTDCPEDVEFLIGLLNKNNPPREILHVYYEPVTGAHVGPDTLALFFMSEEGIRNEKLPVPGLLG